MRELNDGEKQGIVDLAHEVGLAAIVGAVWEDIQQKAFALEMEAQVNTDGARFAAFEVEQEKVRKLAAIITQLREVS